MSRSLFFGLILLVTIVALVFRLPGLAKRPMHGDEAVNAVKIGELIEGKGYRYDPHEYHGPTLNYFSLIPAWLAGADSFVGLSESLLRINEVDLALRNFIRASEINPNNALNWINISQLRQNLGEFDAAADAAAKATLAAPKNPDAHNQLGVTSIQIADHEDAIRAFENAFELSPMFGPFAANLANFYKQNLSSEDVLIRANRFLANNPDALALLCLKAEMLLRANDLEEAINTLSHAENINPRDPEVMRLQLEAMRVQQRIGRVNSQNMTPDQLAEAYDKLITN